MIVLVLVLVVVVVVVVALEVSSWHSVRRTPCGCVYYFVFFPLFLSFSLQKSWGAWGWGGVVGRGAHWTEFHRCFDQLVAAEDIVLP